MDSNDMNLETVGCPLCETAPDAKPYKRENGFEALQCSGCGLVFVSPRPVQRDMKALYESGQTHVNIGSHVNKRDYKRVQARACLKSILHHRQRGRLLEVGCAAGYFLEEAQKAGFDVQGLDVTRPFVRFCNDVLGVPAAEGSLADAPFEPGTFDVVYHRNLLSHLHEPVADFRRIHELLAPDGLVVFETGNVAELAADEAGDLELPEHLYHFSERTIRALLDKTKFVPISITRHGLVMQMKLFAALERLVEKPPKKKREPAPVAATVTSLPDESLVATARAHVAQLIRYDLGAALGGVLPRATLIVVARARSN